MKRLSLASLIKHPFSSTVQPQHPHHPPTLLTGLQPTGSLHLGNYFGSILSVLKHQQNPTFTKRFVFIADLHSLTTAFTAEHDSIVYNNTIGKDSFQMIKTLLACGVQPGKTTLFVQSHVPEHSELAWILSCFANQHALNFMIQYKEKANQTSSVGLYTYPLLMASDILIYRSTHVPVGVDQVQHLELTNKIRERFNKVVKENYFPHVKYLQAPKTKIMSLTNPQKKMSKSDSNPRSRIHLTDSHKQIHQKLRRAVTDSQGNSITYQPQRRVGLSNLIDIYSVLSNLKPQEVVLKAQENKWGIGDFKNELGNEIWKVLGQMQQRMKEMNDTEVRRLIVEGADRAREEAAKNIKEVKRLLALL